MRKKAVGEFPQIELNQKHTAALVGTRMLDNQGYDMIRRDLLPIL